MMIRFRFDAPMACIYFMQLSQTYNSSRLPDKHGIRSHMSQLGLSNLDYMNIRMNVIRIYSQDSRIFACAC